MMSIIDSILNRYTMYRVVLYGLILLLVVGFVFALTGDLSISAGGLLISVAVLMAVSYAVNKALAMALKVATSTESWLITALILACILPPSTNLVKILAIALSAVIAMAAKFLLTRQRSPLFNPAAAAALIMSISGLLQASWWIGSPPMAAFTAIIGLLILRKQRKFSLFAAFALASLAILLFVNHISGDQTAPAILKTLLLSWPLIFMGSVMLTEPSTLPPTRYYQVLYGILVGSVFTSELHAGRVSTTPQAALIVGNIFAAVIGQRFASGLALKHQTETAANIHELVFDMPKNLSFLPGQYLEWTMPHAKVDSRGNRRSFSIAASPTESELRLGFKSYEPSSSFKTALLALKPGQFIRAARPAGDFLLPTDQTRPLIFIAGGIGITPFRSMIKYLIDTRQKRRIILFYVANPAEVAYRQIFNEAEAVGVKTYYISGRLEAAAISSALKQMESPLVYISGPNAMVQYYKKLLGEAGVSQRQIHTDFFSGY